MSEQKISNIPLKAAQFNRHRQAQIRFASKICSQICIFMFKVPQWKFSNVSFTHANKKKTRKQTHKEWTWVQAYDLSKDRRFQHFDYSYQPKTKTVACNRQESLTNPNHLDLKQNICSALHSRRNPPIRNNEDNFFSHKRCTFQSQPKTTHCFTSYWPKKKKFHAVISDENHQSKSHWHMAKARKYTWYIPIRNDKDIIFSQMLNLPISTASNKHSFHTNTSIPPNTESNSTQ